MTTREVIRSFAQAAMEIYGEREAQQIARFAVMELGHYTPTQLVIGMDDECNVEGVEHISSQIASGRPLQYIVGQVEFSSLMFEVSEGVLIPRPETEELVEWIVSECDLESPHIADIGTGSGVIAISLAKRIVGSKVWALDLSKDALCWARRNSELNSTNVTFVEGDAVEGVECYLPTRSFDIVVSNPPYIPRGECEGMRVNVVGFEPHMALFVDDDDPLIFYRRIAESSRELLTNCGKLYFEIHENFASEMISMLEGLGYKSVVCRRDINEKPRMICAQWML